MVEASCWPLGQRLLSPPKSDGDHEGEMSVPSFPDHVVDIDALLGLQWVPVMDDEPPARAVERE